MPGKRDESAFPVEVAGGAVQDHSPLLSCTDSVGSRRLTSAGTGGHVPSMCPERDPAYLAALEAYVNPAAADVAGRDIGRLEAVLTMRAIRRRYSSGPATNVPLP